MSSSPLIALEKHLADLRAFFIVTGKDYNLYTLEDHTKALAFRLLASASIEDYVEQRCKEIARQGIDRFLKSQPTATGRALIMWHVVRKKVSRSFPIHEADAYANIDIAAAALGAYEAFINASHGIAGRDLQQLAFPLGLRDHQVPTVLVTGLNELSKARDPASHVYVNRAKVMTEPVEEWNRVDQLMPHIRQLDTDLGAVVQSFPI